MELDSLGFGVMFVLVFSLAVAGVIFISMDFRHYNDIYKQCKESGFVQNKTTRITCKVE